MKHKFLLLAIGLFAAIGTIKADDVYFTVDEVDVMQGETAKVTVLYNADGFREYKGAQVEFILPNGLTVIDCELGAEVSANNPVMSLSFNPRREFDDKTVFLLSQIDLTGMPVGDGIELFSFTVEADEDCELGEYEVKTMKIELGSPQGKATFDPKTIIFNVVAHSASVLEDTSEEIPESSEVPEDVIVKRNVKANVWSTICLPFEMSRDQLKEVFGYGMFLAEFVSTEMDGNMLYVNFDPTNELEANHPYIIKSENELTEFTVSQVMVSPNEEDAQLLVDNGSYGSHREEYGVFHGTLRAGEYFPEQGALVYIRDNKFYYNTASIYMNAFRGYFEFNDFNPSHSTNVVIVVDDEPATVDGLVINGREMVFGGVYNILGAYMGRAEDVMNSLPSGVYIINNKKVVVK